MEITMSELINIPNSLLFHKQLSHGAKILYIQLNSSVDKQTSKKLATTNGVATRTIRRWKKELKTYGFLTED